MEANKELAEEVDKLYKSEDMMMKEMRNLKQNPNKPCQDSSMENKSRSVVIEKLLEENEQIILKNDLLTKTQEKTLDKLHFTENELEKLRIELEIERENVVKITKWKDALVGFFSAD